MVRPQVHSVNTDKRYIKNSNLFFVVSFLGVVSTDVVAVGLVVSSSSSLVVGW
jgi:hypothetical protein